MTFVSITRLLSTVFFCFAFLTIQGCYDQPASGSDTSLTASTTISAIAAATGSATITAPGGRPTTESIAAPGDPLGPDPVTVPARPDSSNSAGSALPGSEDATTDPSSAAPGSVQNPLSPTSTRGAAHAVEISLHPASQTIHTAQSATLNVSAASNHTLRYQWRKNGRVIQDAVRSSYTISNAGEADEGSYDVIVTSGTTVLISRIARITVASDRSASLSWSAPTHRADGSPLAESEIAAYRIYHSNDDGSIGREYEVQPDQTRFELTELPSGAHHFAIATVDVGGMESNLSAVVTKRVM